MLEDHQPQPTTDDLDAPAIMMEQHMWSAAVRGKNKGRGLGFEAQVSSSTFTSASPLLSPLPYPVMEDHIGHLEMM
ncbi:UNVERIFIED_CONTAM: hypothetical protein Sindi_2272000, partial [Sesamum indicum]